MVGFELLNVIQSAVSDGDMWRRTKTATAASAAHGRHFVSRGRHFPRRRTTPAPTLPPTTKNNIVASNLSDAAGAAALLGRRPVTLTWLCLIKYLRNDKLAFFLLLVLAQMVLVHDPVGFFGFSIFSEVGVKYEDFLAALLAAAGHNRSCFAGLMPPCFAAALEVAFRLDFSSLSCSCGVGF